MGTKRLVTTFAALAAVLAAVPIATAVARDSGSPSPGHRVLAHADIEHTITYHGRLTDNGQPANGAYDIQFRLFGVSSGGTVITTVDRDNLQVSQGLFSAELDFGDVWDGSKKWIELAIRPGTSTGSYTTLIPRQAVNGSPYAYGLHLPFNGNGSTTSSGSSSPALYEITQTGTGTAIRGKASVAGSTAVEGDGGAGGTGGEFKGAVAIDATGPVNVTGPVTATGVVQAGALRAGSSSVAGQVSATCDPTGRDLDSAIAIPAADEADDIVVVSPVAAAPVAFALAYDVAGCPNDVWVVVGTTTFPGGTTFNYIIVESD